MDKQGPPCECHGINTRWSKDAKMRAGGYWRCRVDERTYEQRMLSLDRRLKEMIRKRRFARKKSLTLSEAKLLILKYNREVHT